MVFCLSQLRIIHAPKTNTCIRSFFRLAQWSARRLQSTLDSFFIIHLICVDWLKRRYPTRWISAWLRWASRSFAQPWSRLGTTADERGLESWPWLERVECVVVLLPGDLGAELAASLALMTVQKAKHLLFFLWMVPNGDPLSLVLTDTLNQFLFLVSDLRPSLFHEPTQWIESF